MNSTNTPDHPDFRYTVGIDMDGVLCEYEDALRQVVATELGIDPSEIPASESWNFANWPIRDREHYTEMHVKGVESGMFRDMGEIDGASDALWDINDRYPSVRFRIITHRLTMVPQGHERIVADTVAWLQKAREDGRPRIPYHDIALLGTRDAAKESVGADIYVDDSPSNIAALRLAGQEGIVFSQIYNAGVPGLRADNWADVVSIIDDRMHEQRFLRDLQA